MFPSDIDGFAGELQAIYCRGGEFCPIEGKRR